MLDRSANKMTEVLAELAGHTPEDFHHPLLTTCDERYLVVLITRQGLCGAFNTNLTKRQVFLKENPGSRSNPDRRRKGQTSSVGATLAGEYVGLTGKAGLIFRSSRSCA